MMNLSEKIKNLRKEKRWSQGELAKKLNVHITHISRIETGKYQPSVDLLKKIAKLFEVSTDYLLFDDAKSYDLMGLENKDLFEKMKLVNSLEEKDREIITGVIDAFLTKKRVWQIVSQKKQHVNSKIL